MTIIAPVKPAAAPAPTIGQSLDADIAALKARVSVLEGNVVSFWAKQTAWLKANWPHIVTWLTLAYTGGAAKVVSAIASKI
ncbi:MAG: hypothetical protein ACLP7Q_02475 [Isosphaeraceae bacterium]